MSEMVSKSIGHSIHKRMESTFDMQSELNATINRKKLLSAENLANAESDSIFE